MRSNAQVPQPGTPASDEGLMLHVRAAAAVIGTLLVISAGALAANAEPLQRGPVAPSGSAQILHAGAQIGPV
jgi:hypothetical protein